MSAESYVLFNYPLSDKFRNALESRIGAPLRLLSVPELRRMRPGQLLCRIAAINADRLLIALEDETTIAILPALQLIAASIRARSIEVVLPDLSFRNISRIYAASSGATLLAASLRSWRSARKCARELPIIVQEPRVTPLKPTGGRVLYLNANLWFGVKAGGSVGHISGVANAFLNAGYDLDFASAGGRLMIGDGAGYIPLNPPNGYGLPYDYNYYHFHQLCTSTMRNVMSGTDYSFIYQRLSIANYTGVILSRDFRIPLVVEYNGSEAWIAKHWGRPLAHSEQALLAEDACLKHAHLVVTISDVLRDELIERGVDPERVVFYPNCIDPKIFEPSRYSADDLKAVRVQHGIPDDAVVVTFIGTFGQWHGVDVLARVVRRFVERDREWLIRNKVHFLIVGDGLKMPVVRDILAPEEFRPFYTLTGLVLQAEAPKYLAVSDVLVSPHVNNEDGSRFFGSPTKLFEYMAMRKGIVASDLDQIGAVLENSVRTDLLPQDDPAGDESRLAVLFPPGDTDAFERGIRFLVERRSWRELLGENARQEALRKYTWEHHVQAICSQLSALDLI